MPGSLRTDTMSVECIAGDVVGRSGHDRAGRASTRNRVRLRGSDWMSAARTSSPNSAAARGDSTAADPVSAAVRDHLAGARGVGGREQAPVAGPQECLGLTQRLDVGIDPLDVLEPLTGERRQAQPDGHDDLAHDGHIGRGEQVLDLLDRPEHDVLDGHDAPVHRARGDRFHDVPEARQPIHGRGPPK